LHLGVIALGWRQQPVDCGLIEKKAENLLRDRAGPKQVGRCLVSLDSPSEWTGLQEAAAPAFYNGLQGSAAALRP
jgi:hypothetical protein